MAIGTFSFSPLEEYCLRVAFSVLFNLNFGMFGLYVYLCFLSNLYEYLECIRLQIVLQMSPA